MAAQDSADALARILREGKISDDLKTIAELKRSLAQARRFFDMKRVRKLNKPQSIALDRLIAENPQKMEALDFSDPDLNIGLLPVVSVDNPYGRVEKPITALALDLTETYFRLKGTQQVGGVSGPRFRFVKACFEHLNLAHEMPKADNLRNLTRAGLQRRRLTN